MVMRVNVEDHVLIRSLLVASDINTVKIQHVTISSVVSTWSRQNFLHVTKSPSCGIHPLNSGWLVMREVFFLRGPLWGVYSSSSYMLLNNGLVSQGRGELKCSHFPCTHLAALSLCLLSVPFLPGMVHLPSFSLASSHCPREAAVESF